MINSDIIRVCIEDHSDSLHHACILMEENVAVIHISSRIIEKLHHYFCFERSGTLNGNQSTNCWIEDFCRRLTVRIIRRLCTVNELSTK